MFIMKKQRNLRYPISILAFFLIISTIMVTSSLFQMLLDVTPSIKSPLSFKFANAADDKENSAHQQGDVKAEESDKEFDQTSFKELGGGDESADVDQEAQTETDQEATNAEDVDQEAQTETDQEATNAEDVDQEAQTETDQEATNAEDVDQEAQTETDQEATNAEDVDQEAQTETDQEATNAE